MSKKIGLKIEHCGECPHLQSKRVYTEDSFEHGEKWECGVNGELIGGFVEWNDDKRVPNWCPILVKETFADGSDGDTPSVGFILNYLVEKAKEYRTDTINSINCNSHMNDVPQGTVIEQNVVDGILVDFINFLGMKNHVDYGLHTSDIVNGDENSDDDEIEIIKV